MNNADQLARQFEDAMARLYAAQFAIAVISLLVFYGLLYLTIRYAIRDGLRDAQRPDRRTAVTRSRDQIPGPDIRTD